MNTFIHYIADKNIFVVIVCKLLEQQKNWKDYFEITDKQTIKMPKKGEYIKFKNFGRKIKSPFMIYADFECILVPEDNGKENPNESYAYVLMINLVNLLNNT